MRQNRGDALSSSRHPNSSAPSVRAYDHPRNFMRAVAATLFGIGGAAIKRGALYFVSTSATKARMCRRPSICPLFFRRADYVRAGDTGTAIAG